MYRRMKKIIPKRIKWSLKRSLKVIKDGPKYNEIIKKKFANTKSPKFVLLVTPNSSNLGDHAITEAEKQFISGYFPNYDYVEISLLDCFYGMSTLKKLINKDDVILINGGGFLGNLWMEAEYIVRDIITKFPNNKLIIMPQTIFFDRRYDMKRELENSQKCYNSHSDLTIFLREKNSYDFVVENFESSVNPKLVPDIVTYLSYDSFNTSREGVLMCFRNDKEKVNHSKIITRIEQILKKDNQKINYTDTVIEDDVNEYNRNTHLENKYQQFSEHKLVITDRLHGMLFSLITGTPCIAMNNSSGKVKGVYKWIEKCNYIVCLDDDEVSDSELVSIIDKQLSFSTYGYNNNAVIEELKPLVSELKQISNKL